MATRKSIWILIGIVVITGWLLGSVIQAVAETKEFRTVCQFSKLEIMPVGDVEGHILYIAELRGLAFVDGEVAVYVGWGQGEVIKGVGPSYGYEKYIYQDGSTIVYKGQGTVRVAPDGKTSLHEGKGEFTMGTGRFEGIKGSISYTGKRFTAISPGLKETRGDMVFEETWTYTLPSK